VGGVADNMAHIVPLVSNYNLLGECPIPSILKKKSFAVLENDLAHWGYYSFLLRRKDKVKRTKNHSSLCSI
jgi:hypothetical protein